MVRASLLRAKYTQILRLLPLRLCFLQVIEVNVIDGSVGKGIVEIDAHHV